LHLVSFCHSLSPFALTLFRQRLVRPTPIAIRWRSTITPSNDEGDGQAAEAARRELRGVTPDDTFANVLERRQQDDETSKDGQNQSAEPRHPELQYSNMRENQYRTPLPTSQNRRDASTEEGQQFAVRDANGVFERPRAESRTNPLERQPTPDRGNDVFAKVLVAGQQPEHMGRGGRGRDSRGIFDRSGTEHPEDIYEDLQSARPQDFRNKRVEFPVLELPEDPSQLKALPTGFHDMTFEEQQEELWIVHAESRLGREWEMQDSGKHRPYNNDYPPYSPPKVLGMLHRWRSRPWTAHEWRLARAIAGNRSLRLPVLATQAWLRRHALLARRRGVELKIERYLSDTEEWKANLADLEGQTGITEADIKQWLWILYPVSGDAKLQRFIKSDCRKPLFLLTLLLAKDKTIQEPATFVALLKYIKENYVLAERPPDEASHPAYQGQGRSMTWWHYLVFLYRLVWHCREGWPAAMPLLSRLTADYIGTMRLEGGGRAMTGYQARSLVLNKALQYFSWPARVRPLDHMEHNWAAQRHLLRLAAAADPPLVMDQNGYRSVRKVLIALSKTKAEAKNADRTNKTWPPYRRTFDGVDERRHPEDDLSRSAKAGILVREAGYEDDIVDRALSALGGSTFGQSPTIQTRSLPPPFFSGQLASHNIYSEWAAQVNATRNAREAWMVFENPPEPDIRPNLQVYAEMFEKLYARPVSGSPAIRPGDAKEVFPVHDGSLSEFEIARLTPPSPEELYDTMMMHDKIMPAGNCLAILVQNARSKTAALRYLSDSPYEPYIKALRERVSWEDGESLKTLSRIPVSIFNAWIAMLCRLHTRTPRSDSMVDEPLNKTEDPNPSEVSSADASSPAGQSPVQNKHLVRGVSQGGSILEAIELATAFQAYNPKSAHRDAQPWHTIMGALAGTKILYSRMGAAYNVLETLVTFLKLYQRTILSKGIDPVSFEALCLVLRKTLRLSTFQEINGEVVPRDFISASSEIEKMVFKAHRYAVKGFKDLTSPVPGNSGSEGGPPVDMPRYNVAGRPLYRYMMALGCCGDQKEMVRVMDWILDGWDRDYIREEAKAPHDLKYHYMMRTFAYFVKVGTEVVEPEEMQRLEMRLEELRRTKDCTWFWPTDSWADVPAEIPEGDTDRVLLERWPRLRQMVNFGDPDVASVESLSELKGDMPMVWEGQPLSASDLT
jgi:DNA (cytosine-5)-methyltransferase 1